MLSDLAVDPINHQYRNQGDDTLRRPPMAIVLSEGNGRIKKKKRAGGGGAPPLFFPLGFQGETE